jgi:SAM-dependent methyltransferase
MIKVLQSWSELAPLYEDLTVRNLPPHFVAQKNFDLYHLRKLVDPMPRSAAIVDLGCSEGSTLWFLQSMGFTNLYGIDLRISWQTRAKQLIRMARSRSLRPQCRLYQGDLTAGPFKPAMFDVGVCISTIEHGVPLPKFFAECRRILKPSAPLFVTTDYWEPKIRLADGMIADGLAWRISGREDIEELIQLAREAGFTLVEDNPIPACQEPCVTWQGQRYTFALSVFKRSAD